MISVALQLPDSECGSSTRLTGKFPTTTTIWLLLRHFESEISGSEPRRNFTARGIPQSESGKSSSGRLFYETPVIQAMGRELSSFTDLQKSLAQLGFNNGSVLLRLNFRKTECPLEESIAEIDQYFRSSEGEDIGGTYSTIAATTDSTPSESIPSSAPNDSERQPLPDVLSPSQTQPSLRRSAALLSSRSHQGNEAQARAESGVLLSDVLPPLDQTRTSSVQRPLSIFAPSSDPTPAASRQAFNEKDYEPTITHAKLHQARLATSSVNKRLPTDAELAVQADIQAKRNADIKDVQIKVRFPDQMQVISTFTNLDTSSTLYEFVRGLMKKENEPFSLNFSSAQGPRHVPKEDNVRLIGDLDMAGRVLVNVAWEIGASGRAREGSVLKAEFQKQAKQIEVKEVEGVEVEEQVNNTVEGKGKQKDEGQERKANMPRWLKLPGKK